MGHFVEKNFMSSIPGMVKNKVPAETNLASFTEPIPPFAFEIPEAKKRPPHQAPL
jgi:hypothetical protein